MNWYRFPAFRFYSFALALVFAVCLVCSVCVAAPSGWICGPAGCRPAGISAGQRLHLRENRGRGPLRALIDRLKNRRAARGC